MSRWDLSAWDEEEESPIPVTDPLGTSLWDSSAFEAEGLVPATDSLGAAYHFLPSQRLPAKASEWRLPESDLIIVDLPTGSLPGEYHFAGALTGSVVNLWGMPSAPSTQALDTAIQSARALLLSLGDDWDDGEGERYLSATIDRATGLLKRLGALWLTRRLDPPLPVITPADAGSIDLYWSNQDRTLLVNVPAGADASATFSGRRGSGDTIAGTIDLHEGLVSHLAAWLTE